MYKLNFFKYMLEGKHSVLGSHLVTLRFSLISDTKRALTLPMKMTQQQLHGHGRSSSTLSDMPLDGLMCTYRMPLSCSNSSTLNDMPVVAVAL